MKKTNTKANEAKTTRKNEKLPPIKELETHSIYGKLVTICKSKEDIAGHVRQLVFPEMESDIAKRYHSLNLAYKRLVGKMVDELIAYRENHGFNLSVYLYWLENQSFPNVRKSIIAEHFFVAHYDDLIDYTREHITDPYNGEYESEIPFDSSLAIANRIRSLTNSKKIKPDTKLFQVLQNNLLFSPELITEGRGEIYGVNEEIMKRYDELDIEDEFYKDVRDDFDTNGTGELESHLIESVKNPWEDFAKRIGKTWDEIKETEYAVINYSYGYMFLNKSPIKGAKELVDYMIEQLYAQQTEHEKVLQENDEAHKKIEAAFFEQILKNGGATEETPKK